MDKYSIINKVIHPSPIRSIHPVHTETITIRLRSNSLEIVIKVRGWFFYFIPEMMSNNNIKTVYTHFYCSCRHCVRSFLKE